MSDWMTKYGSRRVKQAPPTLEEAVFAAQGITDDPAEQADIAAALMGIPLDSAKAAVRKSAPNPAQSMRIISNDRGAPRAFVVERRISRRPASAKRVESA